MRALTLSAVAALLSLTVARTAPADEFSETRARAILSVAIDTGAPIFNAGDHEGCYRVYRGALESIRPLLRDRHRLREDVASALRRAEHTSSRTERAWILRHTIDRLLEDLR
jgi:hypothetical protein